MSNNKIVSALDIGTSKIVVLIAEILSDDEMKIIGMSSQVSTGLKKGVVVNIDATSHAISKAVAEAERMADCEISPVTVGIAGSHIKSFDSFGVVAIQDNEVSKNDVNSVISSAKAVAIPTDEEILHILPQDFIIDNEGGIKEPIGMSGVRLETKIHMVTGGVPAIQNITKCIERCGLNNKAFVLEQLASSESVLSDDEKELGVCLIDIGAGTTDVAVYLEGAIVDTTVIALGGSQITSDIAHGLRTATEVAENIKIEHGHAISSDINDEQEIEIPGLASHPSTSIKLKTLSSIIEARLEEILSLVYHYLSKNNILDKIAAGIVITGGSANTNGIIILANEIYHMPVRIGLPKYIVSDLDDTINNPMYATAVGLLLHSKNNNNAKIIDEKKSIDDKESESSISKVKKWFGKHF